MAIVPDQGDLDPAPDPLPYALEYAGRGWRVFRLNGKIPLAGTNGFHDATLDTAQIIEWWEGHPELGIGIATGRVSGIVVLDVDGLKGFTSLEKYTGRFGKLPDTVTSHTGGGGWHCIFSYPIGREIKSSVAALGEGLDIRADGGYIVAPPTLHPSGNRYRWTEQRPLSMSTAPASEWLLEQLEARSKRLGPALEVESIIPSKQRNDTLAKIAGSVRRLGADQEEIVAFISTVNKKRCKPPLDEDEVGKIATSIGRYEPETEIGIPETSRYQFSDADSFFSYPYPEAEPLLGEPGSIYLAAGSLLLVYGAEGTGKSTLSIDAIACLGAGREWLGIPVSRAVRWLTIENEGPPGLFQQKLREKLFSEETPPENVHVYQSPWGEFTFSDPEARYALTSYCDEHEIDVICANPTLGLGVAASGTPNETNEFVSWLKECGLGANRAFWLLHHENKAGQISGDWGRHPDTKVQLQADGDRPRTKLVWEKTRWATLPTSTQSRSVILEWIVDTAGYKVIDIVTVAVPDDELQDRVDEYLREHPWASTKTIENEVQGNSSRIRKVLDNGRYDTVGGANRAKLWNLAPDLVLGSKDPRISEE